MTDTAFHAQALLETKVVASTQSFEMKYEDANGATHTVSLPVQIAADMLTPVLSTLTGSLQAKTGGPAFSRMVQSWAVGSSTEQPLIRVRFDSDMPLSLKIDDAKKIWRAMREEIELVSRRKPPFRQ